MVNLRRSLEEIQQNDYRQRYHLLPLLKDRSQFESLCLEVLNAPTILINEIEDVGCDRLILVRVGLHLCVIDSVPLAHICQENGLAIL